MDPGVASPRARAAWAFSGLRQRELADEAGIAYDRLRVIMSGDRARDIALEELFAIAQACGVPRAFMEHGFEADGALEERVDELEQARAAHEAAITELRAALLTDVTEDLRRTRERVAPARPGTGRRAGRSVDPA